MANRIQKILEDANIKLASVVTDILGVSGRAMLKAIVAGQSDPEQLAELARGTLRGKISQLVEVLTGTLRSAHRFRLEQHLQQLEFIESQIGALEAEIERQNVPFQESVRLLAEIPGFNRVAAWSVLAEIGVDMDQFPTAAHLASWAGVCPGNHESAGKRMGGRIRPGNRWLREKLTQSAWATSRSKKSYFSAFFHRMAARRGKKRAIVALGHALLVVCYYLLKRQVAFQDLGIDYFDHLNEQRLTRYFVKRLTRLGHHVVLDPLPQPSAV